MARKLCNETSCATFNSKEFSKGKREGKGQKGTVGEELRRTKTALKKGAKTITPIGRTLRGGRGDKNRKMGKRRKSQSSLRKVTGLSKATLSTNDTGGNRWQGAPVTVRGLQ